MSEPIRTVGGPGRAGFTVEGSRFLGHAGPARTVEEADKFINEVEAEHPEATHVVPASRVRAADGSFLTERADDRGEPTGSAGKPVLTVLQRRGLEDVVVAVVRYFGGTELGIGGLSRAYVRAASAAIDDAGVIDRVPTVPVRVRVGYDDSGTARRVLEAEGLDFEADYAGAVTFEAWLPAADRDRIADRLLSATSGRADIEPR